MAGATDKETTLRLLETLCPGVHRQEVLPLLQPIYRELSAAVGLETTLELYFLLAGQQLTFPRTLYKTSSVKEQVQREYDGTNIRHLSRKYLRSEKTIRRFLAEKK